MIWRRFTKKSRSAGLYILKKVINDDHWAFISWHKKHFGLYATFITYIKMVLSKKNIACVYNPLSSEKVLIRPGSSDQNVYDEVFINNEYEMSREKAFFIIDAGANIGLASVYFAIKYPKAIIVSIEPEESNFNMLVQNSKNIPNIYPIKSGLWSKKTSLQIQNPDATSWGFRVIESPDGQGINALSIDDVMSSFNVTQIDILKMDIEGSEKIVLKHSSSWMDKVKTLVIELHDRFQPGCTEALEQAISDKNFDKSYSESSVILTKKTT